MYILRIQTFNIIFLYIFLVHGVLLLVAEIISKVNRKRWVRIVLLMIPALTILLAIQCILKGTFTIIPFTVCFLMHYMLSERTALVPKKS